MITPSEDFQTPIQIYSILKANLKTPITLLNYLYIFKRWSEVDTEANQMESMKAACRRRFYSFIIWLSSIKQNLKMGESDYDEIMQKENKDYIAFSFGADALNE